jgi:hypothetical protein
MSGRKLAVAVAVAYEGLCNRERGMLSSPVVHIARLNHVSDQKEKLELGRNHWIYEL